MIKRKQLLILIGLILVSLTNCVGMKEIPAEAEYRINKLNDGDINEIDIAECPTQHPGWTISGETLGWILLHKEKLKALGFGARWNCAKKQYELTTEEQTSTPFCECQPTPTISPAGSGPGVIFDSQICFDSSLRN